MSLNRTLLRLFYEVRREAKRNPDFADRLDAILQAHQSRRDVSEAAREAAEEFLDELTTEDAPRSVVIAPQINPVGLYQRAGADVLRAALDDPEVDELALRALISEHNLDPGGEAESFDRAALVAHIVTSAERRAERDRKMFDY